MWSLLMWTKNVVNWRKRPHSRILPRNMRRKTWTTIYTGMKTSACTMTGRYLKWNRLLRSTHLQCSLSITRPICSWIRWIRLSLMRMERRLMWGVRNRRRSIESRWSRRRSRWRILRGEWSHQGSVMRRSIRKGRLLQWMRSTFRLQGRSFIGLRERSLHSQYHRRLYRGKWFLDQRHLHKEWEKLNSMPVDLNSKPNWLNLLHPLSYQWETIKEPCTSKK